MFSLRPFRQDEFTVELVIIIIDRLRRRRFELSEEKLQPIQK